MERWRAFYGARSRTSPTWFRREDGRNTTLLESFEWYVPEDQQHWRRLRAVLPELHGIGINHLWLPPGCKASGSRSNGYDVYDLYDLGEFDWKGGRATKWGLKDDLIALAEAARELGIGLIWDAVLSHKAAADSKETVQAVEVKSTDRNKAITAPKEIEAWVGFEFPGRNGVYSSMRYHKDHFSGVDYDARSQKNAIFRFSGKKWATDVDDENGNSDYLMFSNLDYSSKEVRQDVNAWGSWIETQIPLSGMRLDAIRHLPENFIREFISHVRAKGGAQFGFVGEYWKASLPALRSYLSRQAYMLSLFDVPLVYNLARTSKSRNPDLRTIFRGTLVSVEPEYAITCVTNHDSQPGQALSPDATIERSFLPLAYAMILLRAAGTPCIFYGDLYGTHGPHAQEPLRKLPLLCTLRARFSYGKQRDYFDNRHCVGWTREGSADFNGGTSLAVLMHCNGAGQSRTQQSVTAPFKKMCVGQQHKNEVWKDVLGSITDTVKIDENGTAVFQCMPNAVSVWVHTLAWEQAGSDTFDSDIYKHFPA